MSDVSENSENLIGENHIVGSREGLELVHGVYDALNAQGVDAQRM